MRKHTEKRNATRLAESKDKLDLKSSLELFRYHFIKSLILAQDERWRRA